MLVAGSTSGGAGFLAGPANQAAIEQSWTRVDGRKQAAIVNGNLVIHPRDPGEQPAGWQNSGYRYLDSLPTSPARLTAVIEASIRAENFVVGRGPGGIFTAINDLIENAVLPPRLNAALYAVLARLPGVHYEPSVADFAGQRGLGFYMIQEGYLKVEIVINPKTYAYLGTKWVAVRAHTETEQGGPTVHFAPGHVLGWAAVLKSGIVQHAGQDH